MDMSQLMTQGMAGVVVRCTATTFDAKHSKQGVRLDPLWLQLRFEWSGSSASGALTQGGLAQVMGITLLLPPAPSTAQALRSMLFTMCRDYAAMQVSGKHAVH